MSAEPSGRRLGGLAFVAVLVFGTLISRLWFLQVMSSPKFEEQAASNRTREIFVEAPRGRIIDAKGRILADRRESFVVTLDWVALQDLQQAERLLTFEQVADILNEEGIKSKLSSLQDDYDRAKDGSLKPVVVAEDIDVRTWLLISESDYVGFAVERRWVRSYPYGSIGAHILGYTGTVSDSDQAEALNAGGTVQHYLAGDEIGIAGLEAVFESTLRGTPEHLRVEIDARQRVVRTAEVLQEGAPGQDIYLTLDIDLQYAAEVILEEELQAARRREACDTCEYPHVGQAGSLVALDVTDGSVIALASYPTYDPSDFVFGISSEQFSFLRERDDQPLFARATRGLYPAGSTFKPVTAYAALISGARHEYTPWVDEGVYVLESCAIEGGAGCSFQNAGGAIMGKLAMRRALYDSSDTYFYSLGEKFWTQPDAYGENRIQEVAQLMGYGEPTGVRLPLEASGRVPTRENRIEEFGEDSNSWRTGDTVNLAIGQGDLLVSPLQIANAYAMLATGGDRYQPRLVDHSATASGEIVTEYDVVQVADDELDPVVLTPILDGLYEVPVRGTASEAFAGFPLARIPLGGKTGTAQVSGKADYALYAGFGPRNAPKYSVVAVLEESGFGGHAAAPAVRRFFDILYGLTEAPVAPVVHEARYEEQAPTIEDALEEPAESEGNTDQPTTSVTAADTPTTVPDESGTSLTSQESTTSEGTATVPASGEGDETTLPETSLPETTLPSSTTTNPAIADGATTTAGSP